MVQLAESEAAAAAAAAASDCDVALPRASVAAVAPPATDMPVSNASTWLAVDSEVDSARIGSVPPVEAESSRSDACESSIIIEWVRGPLGLFGLFGTCWLLCFSMCLNLDWMGGSWSVYSRARSARAED